MEGLTLTEQVIRLAFTAASGKDTESLTNILLSLDLPQLSVANGDTLLDLLLTTCYQYEAVESARVVLNQWQRVYPRLEDIPIYVVLFQITTIHPEVLRFVIEKVFPEISLYKLLSEMMPNHARDIELAAQRAYNTLGGLDYEEAKTLRKLSMAALNAPLSNFLYFKVAQLAPPASIPDYMYNFKTNRRGQLLTAKARRLQPLTQPQPSTQPSTQPQPMTQPYLANLPSFDKLFKLPSISEPPSNMSKDQIIKLIRGNAELNTSSGRQYLIQVEPQLNTSEGREMVLHQWWPIHLTHRRQTNATLFRLYGPVNPFPNQVDPRFGGERMFLSVVYPNNQDDETERFSTDWFDGYCHQCLLQIQSRWYAVRMPLISGGWQGCFCTWRCVRKAERSPRMYEGPIDSNVLVQSMITLFEKQMKTYGIQARKDDGDILAALGLNDPETLSEGIENLVLDTSLGHLVSQALGQT